MKIEITPPPPVFNINEYINSIKAKNKNITFTEWDVFVKDVPQQLAERNNYLRLIADWFIEGVLTPLVKEHINNYLKKAVLNVKDSSPGDMHRTIEQQININNIRRR